MKIEANILEVARLAGVSKSTASRAINNSYGVSEKTRSKVLKAMEELKYKPNINARQLRTKASNTLGILISKEYSDMNIFHEINAQKISGIVKKCSECGFDTLIFIEDVSDASILNNIIVEKNLAGIILMDLVDDEVLKSLKEYSVPFVLINWYSKDYKDLCFVKTDLKQSIKVAIEHLVKKGYQDIGVLNWEHDSLDENEIENTFIECMKAKSLPYEGCVWNTEFELSDKEIQEYMNVSKKRAYICYSYTSSMKIIKYCKNNNLRIPEDIALISYEFFTFFNYLQPALTGIKQNVEAMGSIAADKLIKLINGEKVESEYIDTELVVREST